MAVRCVIIVVERHLRTLVGGREMSCEQIAGFGLIPPRAHTVFVFESAVLRCFCSFFLFLRLMLLAPTVHV